MKKSFSLNTLIFSTLLLFTSLPSLSEATNLHAIILCDTTADNIGFSVEADLKRVRLEIQKIGNFTDMQIKESIFIGHNIDNDLLQKLKGLEIEPDDVAIFFFSGHGFRTDSKQDNIWPNLYLSPINRGLDFNLIITTLEEKKPRLIIAIADCCNNVIPEKNAPSLLEKGRKHSKMNVLALKNNYKTLFLDQSGKIIASGCIPGEFSWGTKLGGLYTVAFFDTLNSEIINPKKPDWHTILDKTSQTVIDRKIGQTPQYELKVEVYRSDFKISV
jgi:hypothetical protein